MINSLLKGKEIHLVPANIRNRRTIYNWMVHSDISGQMFGSPIFPEVQRPQWEEFIEDYTVNYFTDEFPLSGRCFIIKKGRKHIGQINYNLINQKTGLVELDIWLAKSNYTRKGYGTAALQLLGAYLKEKFACQRLFMQPSARNPKAIQAYQKVGFKIVEELPIGMEADYYDSVFMIKKL